MKISTYLRKGLIILFWLVAWTALAMFISNSIILVGPLEVLKAFFVNMTEDGFWQTVASSLIRIGGGFFVSFILALCMGILSYRFSLIKEFLEPLIVMVKSVPVASFVVLLLIWAGADNLAFFISLLIVFPGIYVSTVAGLESTDSKLLEMADTFSLSQWDKARFIYKDALSPYLKSSLKVNLGMAWKSGVAAEVIALPDFSLGSRIYMSKIYLDTADLLAWTLAVVLLCFLFEKIVLSLISWTLDKRAVPKRQNRQMSEEILLQEVDLSDICVSFDGRKIISHMDVHLDAGGIYGLMGESGRGKTTLLNEIEKRVHHKVSRVFQEDRLLEDYDGLTNVMLAAGKMENSECQSAMSEILTIDSISSKVRNYSGGMKRRTAILRAMLNDAPVILLDEPFTGLDEETKLKVIEFILKYRKGRTLLLVTHNEEDIIALGGKRIDW